MNVAPKKKHSTGVDAIFSSDWHLREDTPICRMDDFLGAQWRKVIAIKKLADEYNCPVVIAGDLFHHWKPSPFLLSSTKLVFPKNAFTVYGQHDLPQHNFELRYKSGIYDLEVSGFIRVLENGSWGQEPANFEYFSDRKVGVLHRFIWDGKQIPWPGCDEITGIQLLKKYPEFDIIVTGDHHKSFVVTSKSGRKVVNCGCLSRQTADYANHKPCVWLYNAKLNEVTPHYLKVDSNAVSRSHIDKQEARDERIEAFISRLDSDWESVISFEENLERFFNTNKVKDKTKLLIYKSIDV